MEYQQYEDIVLKDDRLAAIIEILDEVNGVYLVDAGESPEDCDIIEITRDDIKCKYAKKRCACCGYLTLPANSQFEICYVCGWEDDDLQNEDPDLEGGANEQCLRRAREDYILNKNK